MTEDASEGADHLLGSDDHPIIEACSKEDEKLLTILLRAGCDANVTDSRGRTALFIASRSGYTGVVTKLLEHKADVMVRDHESSSTALEEVESLLENLLQNPQCGSPNDPDAGSTKLFRSLKAVASTLGAAESKAAGAMAVQNEKHYGEEEYANDLMLVGGVPRAEAYCSDEDEDRDENEEHGPLYKLCEQNGLNCSGTEDEMRKRLMGGLHWDDERLSTEVHAMKELCLAGEAKLPTEKPATMSQAAWGVLKSWDLGLFVFEKEKNAPARQELHGASANIKALIEEREDEWV
jgi:hypothetical protein